MLNQNQINRLLKTVAEADAAVMEVYDSESVEITLKDDDSPLTQADVASHTILTTALATLTPEIPVVSEEGDQNENRRLVKLPLFWLIDPVDGTREFINRTNEFTVCVSLVERGLPIFGIVSAPALGVTYFGGQNVGSFKHEKNEETAVPITVSPKNTGIVLASRLYQNQETAQYIKEHYPDAEQRSVGSQLKLPYVAEGLADAYPRINGPLHLWDLAAGHAILVAAGGSVTRPDGSGVDYQTETLMVGDFIAKS